MLEISFLNAEEIQDVENIIGYTFKNKELLKQAFTRSSYANENKNAVSNEILEFYGDRAIEQIVTKSFINLFGFIDDKGRYVPKEFPGQVQKINEGFLSILKSEIVKRESLSKQIDSLGIIKYIICGKSDMENSFPESIKEDLFESICGAIAFDSNWNFEIISEPISKMLDLENSLFSLYNVPPFMVTLSKWCFDRFKKYPHYIYHEQSANCYECLMSLRSHLKYIEFNGIGKTQYEARTAALNDAYQFLFEKGGRFKMFEDEIDKVFKKTWLSPSLATSINIVQEMEQVGLLKKVNYEFTQSANDENGDPLWACTVYYKNDFVNNASCTCSNGKTKLDVKKRAALTLLEEVFDEYHIQDFVTIIR